MNLFSWEYLENELTPRFSWYADQLGQEVQSHNWVDGGAQFVDSLAGGLLDLVGGRAMDGNPYSSFENYAGATQAAHPEIHVHGHVRMHEDAARSIQDAQESQARETEAQYAAQRQAEATAGQAQYESAQAEMESFYRSEAAQADEDGLRR